ncbi:MAG: hypothetical protein IJD04_05205 [Desulfovibrionaceae bacterium]|nr:hypothetical protein [Desulfovibrionaceae bacterium]
MVKIKSLLIIAGFAAALAFSHASAAADETQEGGGDYADLEGALQEVQSGLADAFTDMFSVMGSMTSGMVEGMQEGAKQIQARLDESDGARLIESGSDLRELTDVSVFKVEEKGEDLYRITLAIKNANDFPVRLTGLNQEGNVLLLDDHGFAHHPVGEEEFSRIVTVPARAAGKGIFTFSGLDGAEPRLIRIYGEDIPVD